MPTKVLVQAQDGTPKQIVFGDVGGDLGPAAADDLRVDTTGNRTDVQITLVSLANGSARESAKFDFGEDRAPAYGIRAAVELAATPTAGDVIELYLAPSHESAAGEANPGNISGTDQAYTGYSTNLPDAVKQLQYIGSLVVTADATTTVQIMDGGVFSPLARHGSLVVKNESGAAFHSSDANIHIVFDPIVPESQ